MAVIKQLDYCVRVPFPPFNTYDVKLYLPHASFCVFYQCMYETWKIFVHVLSALYQINYVSLPLHKLDLINEKYVIQDVCV